MAMGACEYIIQKFCRECGDIRIEPYSFWGLKIVISSVQVIWSICSDELFFG